MFHDFGHLLTLPTGYLLYMLVNILGWSEDGARALAAHARAQFRKPGVNPYWIRRVAYGRKPE